MSKLTKIQHRFFLHIGTFLEGAPKEIQKFIFCVTQVPMWDKPTRKYKIEMVYSQVNKIFTRKCAFRKPSSSKVKKKQIQHRLRKNIYRAKTVNTYVKASLKDITTQNEVPMIKKLNSEVALSLHKNLSRLSLINVNRITSFFFFITFQFHF